MSGSYDRPTGRRDQASQSASNFDLYDTVLTGPSGPNDRYVYDSPQTGSLDDTPARKFAPSRGRKPKAEPTNTPVVPPDSVTGRSLTLVISIMCFLACLTAGTVYMINESASAWLKDIASEVTVQIEPRDGTDIEKTVREAEAFLRDRGGISRANALSLETSSKLLEPWLGQSDALSALPVPRLIAIEIDRSAPPDIDALRADLTKRFPSASLDDHRRWQRQIRTVTRSFALGGLAILLLVGAATTAIIVSATRSALASNREIVEVLHFVGATDRYIAREFERHFLRLGIRAGVVGALCAMGVFLAMPTVMEMLGGGPTATSEMHRLIGTGGLDATGYVLLAGVVITISALCMLTSRFGVFRILNAKA
ncbi:MAG: cell division protein FtsX [Hyphomicrobium sp.]|jgi:cell division transport system permease protein